MTPPDFTQRTDITPVREWTCSGLRFDTDRYVCPLRDTCERYTTLRPTVMQAPYDVRTNTCDQFIHSKE